MTNYMENAVLQHFLKGGVAIAQPTNLYVSLHTADPTEVGNVSEMTTADFSNYARKLATFGAPTNGVGSTTADLLWDFNGGVNKTVSHVVIWDAVTAGNALFYGPLTASKTLASGDQFKITTGTLSITLD